MAEFEKMVFSLWAPYSAFLYSSFSIKLETGFKKRDIKGFFSVLIMLFLTRKRTEVMNGLGEENLDGWQECILKWVNDHRENMENQAYHLV